MHAVQTGLSTREAAQHEARPRADGRTCLRASISEWTTGGAPHARMADPKAAKRCVDAVLVGLKEYVTAAAAGEAVLASVANLLGRLSALLPKVPAAPTATPLHPHHGAPPAIVQPHGRLAGTFADVLLFVGGVYERASEAHSAEVGKQHANMHTVVQQLEGTVLKLSQTVVEAEKGLRKCSGAGPALLSPPRVPSSPSSPAPGSPALAAATLPGLAPADLFRHALEVYAFMEADLARKRLALARWDSSSPDSTEATLQQWSHAATCGGNGGELEGLGVPTWAHVLEVVLRVNGNLDAVA